MAGKGGVVMENFTKALVKADYGYFGESMKWNGEVLFFCRRVCLDILIVQILSVLTVGFVEGDFVSNVSKLCGGTVRIQYQS